MKKAVIIGAGPVGCLAAEVLARRGFLVDIYEKRPAMQDSTGGRTINLSLTPRGMNALDHFGVGTNVRDACVPMVARAFHPLDRDPIIQPYGQPEWQTYSIARMELSQTLLQLVLRRPEVRVHSGYSCLHVDLNQPALTMRGPDGTLTTVAADLIIGADGVASTVRSALIRLPRVNFAKIVFPGGYRELTLHNADGSYYENAIHIWPRGDFFMVALPNQDRTMRATLVLPESRIAELHSPEAMERFLAKQFPDIIPHLSESPAELFRKPVGEIVTVRCEVLHHKGVLLLLGDAAHAVVPFMGQGVNIGLEDCMILSKMLDEYGGSLEQAFAALTHRRLPEALACADLSEWNLKELTSGRSAPGASTSSLVAQVNFSGMSYRTIAEQAIPNWIPRVVSQ